jgi:poly-gamma-glutamate synthesis protein (capsule biosynthesis protein)
VLQLRLENGQVVSDRWTPALIGPLGGAPLPLTGRARQRAVADWRVRRGCTELASEPTAKETTSYQPSITRITPSLRERMARSRHADCPLPWRDLRYLQVNYVGFDGRTHTGELVVAAKHAQDIVSVFRKLYDARWPIRRMQLVDNYRGDDDLSMAADNTSGFNCRRVKGSRIWSDHAFGAAIDINPFENPYVTGSSIAPSGSRRFATLDRAEGAVVPAGTISDDDVVVRAFAAIGWEWGGSWAEPDYQHFSPARSRPR